MRIDIEKMNDLVAVHVMGWKRMTSGVDTYYEDASGVNWNPPNFEGDLSHTYRLMNFLREEAWIVTIVGSQLGGYDCTLECGPGARGKFYSDPMEGENYTMPEAVCMAALRAYGVIK